MLIHFLGIETGYNALKSELGSGITGKEFGSGHKLPGCQHINVKKRTLYRRGNRSVTPEILVFKVGAEESPS